MKGVEYIKHRKTTVAIVFRNYIKVSGLKFFTPDDNPFQVGIHNRNKDVKISPHLHRSDHPVQVNEIQEILFVQTGKIRVSIYTAKKNLIAKKILKAGDSILQLREAHGVEFLEDSKIFEIKQGPYPGPQNAKTQLK